MNYSTMDVYRDVEHMRGMTEGMVRFSDISEQFGTGVNYFKRVVTGGMFVNWELFMQTGSDETYGVVSLDNGIDIIKVVMNYEESESLDFGDYVKVELMAYWNVDATTGEKTINNEIYKVTRSEVLGKYAGVEKAKPKPQKAEGVPEVKVAKEVSAETAAVEETESVVEPVKETAMEMTKTGVEIDLFSE